MDLKPLTGTLSSGQLTDPAAWSSSIIVAAVYLTPAGWTIQSLGDVLPYDSVGSMLPELKKCILKLRDDFSVSLEAAGKVEVKEDECVAVTRQWDDVELDQASAGRSAEKAPVTKMRMDLSWTFWPAKVFGACKCMWVRVHCTLKGACFKHPGMCRLLVLQVRAFMWCIDAY